ncbi:MAG: DnaJ domain-containing protein [Candidatus Nitrosopolaris sp.]
MHTTEPHGTGFHLHNTQKPLSQVQNNCEFRFRQYRLAFLISKEISNPATILNLLDSRGYYAILGVSEQATYPELKKVYRRLARKYHPDRNNSSHAEITIKKINAAFEILSDEDKRRQYDKADFKAEFDDEEIHSDVQHEVTDTHRIYSDYNSNSRNYDVSDKQYDHARKHTQTQSTVSNFLDSPKGRLQITVEPSLCLAFGSCETLAPKVFVVEKNKRINPKARVESETGANFESILAAAQTCPTKAIKLIDRYTGEQIYP